MIEFVDRRRGDGIFSAIAYAFIALHAVLVIVYEDLVSAAAGFPGGMVALWVGGALAFLSCLVCIVGVVTLHPRVERAGLTSLFVAILAFGLSNILLFNSPIYPGASTGALSLAMATIILHRHVKIGRSVDSSKKLSALLEESEDIKEQLDEEVL